MSLKNEEHKNISSDEAHKIIMDKRSEILDNFIKAYIAETGLKPSEIELCTSQSMNGTTIEHIFFFRKKT